MHNCFVCLYNSLLRACSSFICASNEAIVLFASNISALRVVVSVLIESAILLHDTKKDIFL